LELRNKATKIYFSLLRYWAMHPSAFRFQVPEAGQKISIKMRYHLVASLFFKLNFKKI